MTTESLEHRLQERGLLERFQAECFRSGLTLVELMDSRCPPAPDARRRLYRWLRDEKGFSIARISRLFGRSHGAVIYALKTETQNACQLDPEEVSDA